MAGISWDDSDFRNRSRRMAAGQAKAVDVGVRDLADTVLLASEREVPHDIGTLQSSGTVVRMAPAHYRVGYHTKYAARLHEHPEFRFQKGRKGKYLEDPIKNNKQLLIRGFLITVQNELRGMV